MKIARTLLILAALPCFAAAADVTGTWKAEFDSQVGVQKYTYTLTQDGTNLTGKAEAEVAGRKREAELKEGRAMGDRIAFVEMLLFQGNELRVSYSGTISSNELRLTREVGTFAKEELVTRREGGASPAAAADSGRQRPRSRGLGGPIELGPDDKAAFPNPPEILTSLARASPAAGSRRSSTIPSPSATNAGRSSLRRPVTPPTGSIPCSISSTASAATRRNGVAAGGPR